MAILKVDEIRRMSFEKRETELESMKMEYMREKALVIAGGAPENPGRIKEIRKTIARLKTIQNEERRNASE